MKTCSKCKQQFPYSGFNKSKRYKDGLFVQCKICTSNAHKEWSSKNKEYRNEYARNRYNSNPEPRLKKLRDAYAEDPSAKLEKNKKYRLANPEKELARQKRWRNENKEWVKSQWRSRSAKRRALIAGNSTNIVTKKDIIKIVSKPCTYCGATENIQVDHIVPIARGGSHSIGNLTSACGSCNSSKGKKLLVEWRK